jgi:cell division protein FtsB
MPAATNPIFKLNEFIIMKIQPRILGTLAVCCLLGTTLSQRASAQVSDDAFNALKKTVEQMNQQLQDLQKTNQQDQQQIQDLQQKLGETRSLASNAAGLATNAVEKADAVALAQATPVRSALHNFTMVGDAEIQYGQAKGQNGTFSMADFAPIFLYRANDKTLFEAGFDVTLQNNIDSTTGHANGSSTSVNLSFAQLDYLVNDYVTFVGGYIILPLGTYSERSAGWLNKIPDSPLPVDFLPGAGVGAQLRGAVPIGDSGQQFTYAAYGVNGPSSTDGTANAGALDLGGNVGGDTVGSPNLNGNPSGGGRIGWFYPWKANYDVELGVSGQTGTWSGNYLWSALVVDAAIHIGPNVELKGEYINTWEQTDNAGNIQPQGWWVQGSYKLAGLNLDAPVVNDLELVERYDTANDANGSTTDRFTTGFLYYITNTLWLEGDYEWLKNYGLNANGLPSSQFIVQLSYGF